MTDGCCKRQFCCRHLSVFSAQESLCTEYVCARTSSALTTPGTDQNLFQARGYQVPVQGSTTPVPVCNLLASGVGDLLAVPAVLLLTVQQKLGYYAINSGWCIP